MIKKTPYYLIDENNLLKNLQKIAYVREKSGAKSLLALKCFSAWSVFGLMRKYMDGTTCSSLYEARLGYEKFGKEVHVYSVAFDSDEIRKSVQYADKIIFNSISQLKKFYNELGNCDIGLRINPQISFSDYDLADPARKYSRLGVIDFHSITEIINLINGVMFHYNCENENFDNFSSLLDTISDNYADILFQLDWVSLGGGNYFTLDDYPLEKFIKKLKEFGEHFNVQIYLEPGETVISDSGYLITKVLDIVHNEIDIAIVDSSIEAHMLDLLVYRCEAEIENKGGYRFMIAGRSCLAGDVFGIFNFETQLKVGDIIRIPDAAGYTMVKKNWFNGLKMPSIVVKRLDGSFDVVKTFGYEDFKNSLS
jgi:carboxynorspermidine decarboxylase